MRAWDRNRSHWLAGGGEWPLVLSLGRLTQSDAQLKLDAVSTWVGAWRDYVGAGKIQWQEKRWSDLGRQNLPVSIALASATEVALWAGEDRRWCIARARYKRLIERWPSLATALPSHFEVLADYSDQDFERLLWMLAWLHEHPESNLFPRQLPVPGLDSKWLEARRGLVTELVGAIRQIDIAGQNFFEVCGLRPLPILIRMNLLDAELRARVGGVRDLAAPVNDLARLHLPVRCIFVVENLQTGLAFDDLEGAVVVMAMGYGIDLLDQVPFVHRAPIYYWGDVDTHGFAILSQARGYFPRLQSLMMDEATMLRHRDLWGEEPVQHGSESLPNLAESELAVYRGLKEHKWRFCLRFEQERISWPEAWSSVIQAHDLALKASGS